MGYRDGPALPGSPGQRILEAACELFSRHGIRASGVEEIVARSGVAKATFYSCFRSKDEVALAYLEDLHRARTAAIDSAVRARGEGPWALLGVFDVLEEMAGQGLLPGRSFVHVLFELGPGNPVGRASIEYSGRFREHLAGLAAAAGLRDPEVFARECQLLVMGTVVSAAEGDPDAAGHGRRLAEDLIRRCLAPPDPGRPGAGPGRGTGAGGAGPMMRG